MAALVYAGRLRALLLPLFRLRERGQGGESNLGQGGQFNRRALLRLLGGITLGSAPRTLPAGARQSDSAEPTYTITLPDKQKLYVTLRVEDAPDGGQTVRVTNRPASEVKSDQRVDARLTRDREGKALRARVAFGPNPPRQGIDLEAIPQSDGNWGLRSPELSGSLPFGAPLFGPLVCELFAGRLYDFRRGGEQTFAMFVDEGIPDAEMVTLKLTADGAETLDLHDGPTAARRLKYNAPLPFLPKEQQSGVFWVGPRGELLQCDTFFFGIPLKARGAATVEQNGRRLVLRLAGEPPGVPVVVLRADANGSGGQEITLEIEKGQTIATAGCDARFQMTHLETPWHPGKFTARTVGNTVQWKVEPGTVTRVLVPSERPWFLGDWFATDAWEGPGGAFADLVPGGEGQNGDYLLLTGTAPSGSGPFRVERLPDLPSPVSIGGGPRRLHHYRFTSLPGPNEPRIELGKPLQLMRPVYEIYTDGRRLAAFIGSDKTTLIRDGWETWAGSLPVPSPVYSAPPAPKP